MKKVFGQTVRDLKREVNKKVLKVPGVEQKVLDATSNETWGPHGTLLADIAVASKNYHEYQMIMAVIWKRINDTGKNWRHVYKALIVLEYLVANGSERVIDEIREHAYQISTLADFQYVDPNGRDQGSNVRRKSQSLVMLLNDKEQIMEIRQEAAANRDKFGNRNPGSEMHRPGGYGDRYDNDQYSARDEYGTGRNRGGYRDDDHNSRNGDSYSRDGDNYTRQSEKHYGSGSYKEDDYRNNQNGSRSRSGDKDGDNSLDGDGQYLAQGLNQEHSDQSISGPPSYEEALSESRSPEQNERNQRTSSASESVPKPSSIIVSNDASPIADTPGPSPPPAKQEFEDFDEFDPRVSVPAASSLVDKNGAMDLLGTLSDSFSSNPLSTKPEKSTGPEADPFAANTGFGASDVTQQKFDDPFGEAPFKALPSNDNSALVQPSIDTPAPSCTIQNLDLHQQAKSEPDFGFGDSLSTLTFAPTDSSQFPSHDISTPEEEIDILSGILPPSGHSPVTAAQTTFSAPNEQYLQLGATAYRDFGSNVGYILATSQESPHADMQFNHASANQASFSASSGQADAGVYGNFGSQEWPTTSETPQTSHQTQTGTDLLPNGHFQHQTGPTASPFSAQNGQPALPSTNIYGEFGLQAGHDAPIASQVSLQSQAGNSMQFNQGNFQYQMGPSASLVSGHSHNEQAMQPNNGDFSSHAGLATPVTSQVSPLTPTEMNMPLNHRNFQHQAGNTASQFSPQSQTGQAMQLNNGDFGSLAGATIAVPSEISQAQAGISMLFNNGNFQNKTEPSASPYSAPQNQNGQAVWPRNGSPFPQYASASFANVNFLLPGVSFVGAFSQSLTPQTLDGSTGQLNSNTFLHEHVSGPSNAQDTPSASRGILNNMLPQSEQQTFHTNLQPPVSSSVRPLSIVPKEQSNEKFQTKSTVWSDTLSRGLVDLNISGPKTNPLADIGVDFDSINRKEKRMEKQPATTVISTTTMGKAMGSGSGTGWTGASSLRPPPNPAAGNTGMGMGGMGMVSSYSPGMDMGMGMGGMTMGGDHVSGLGTGGVGVGGGYGSGMGMGGMGGGYGGMDQHQMGLGMGMGIKSGYNNMGMAMNPGMGQGGALMQQQPDNWYNNPMMGGSGYPQQSYGGGYR